MPDPQDTIDLISSIKRTLRVLVVATVVLYLLTFGAAVYVYSQSQLNHNALCTFRGELQDQVISSEQFLKEHPAGLPGLEISAATIRQGVEKQNLAITALSSLSC